MRLKDGRQSTNFEDLTGQSPFEGMLRFMLSPYGTKDQLNQGAPGGHAKWFLDRLNSLTPNDIRLMEASGMTVEDMNRLKNKLAALKSAHPLDAYDASAYPYNENFANKVVKDQKARY